VANPLQLLTLPADDATGGQLALVDFSGRVVERTLQVRIDGLGPVVLPDSRWLNGLHGSRPDD
jgi:two-component system osmolarity sensor histidine kinase EnvZ